LIRKLIIDALLILSIVGLLYTRYVDISLYGARPDLLLIFVTFIGLFEGKYHSIIFGFFGGLTIDIMSGSNLLGVNALMYTLIGYIAILPHKLFHIESVILSPIVIFIFYLIKAFIYMILAYIFFTTNSLAVYFNTIFMGEFIYTILISIPVFFIFKNIYSFMEKLKRYV